MLPVVTRTQADHKTREESVRKDVDRAIVCGHHIQNHSLLGGVVLLLPLHQVSFAPEQAKLVHKHWFFLNGQINIHDVVELSWCYTVTVKTSLIFSEQCSLFSSLLSLVHLYIMTNVAYMFLCFQVKYQPKNPVACMLKVFLCIQSKVAEQADHTLRVQRMSLEILGCSEFFSTMRLHLSFVIMKGGDDWIFILG